MLPIEFTTFVGNALANSPTHSMSASGLLKLSELEQEEFLSLLEGLLKISLKCRREDGSPIFWAGFAWHIASYSYHLVVFEGDYSTKAPDGGEIYRSRETQVRVFCESRYQLHSLKLKLREMSSNAAVFSLFGE